MQLVINAPAEKWDALTTREMAHNKARGAHATRRATANFVEAHRATINARANPLRALINWLNEEI